MGRRKNPTRSTALPQGSAKNPYESETEVAFSLDSSPGGLTDEIDQHHDDVWVTKRKAEPSA
jgi:hypothetical protein